VSFKFKTSSISSAPRSSSAWDRPLPDPPRAMMPKDFGQYGHYRPGALADNAAMPISFAGRAACEECHADVVEGRAGHKHEHVGCEACHGALAAHAETRAE